MDCSLGAIQGRHCSACDTESDLPTWLIVDMDARPDLRHALLRGRLRTFPCPQCGASLEPRPFALLVIRRATEPRAILAVPREDSEEDVREIGSALLGEAAKALGESWHSELTRPTVIPDNMLIEGLAADTLTALTDTQRRALRDATDDETWARAIAEAPAAAEALALSRDLAAAMGDRHSAARAARLLRLSAAGADRRHATSFGDDDVAEWAREADLWAWGLSDDDPVEWIRVHALAGRAWFALAERTPGTAEADRALVRARETLERGIAVAEPRLRHLEELVTARMCLGHVLRALAERAGAADNVPALFEASLEQRQLVVATLDASAPPGDLRRAWAHSDLARAYGARRRGDRADNAERAVEHMTAAVDASDDADPAQRGRLLVNLAEALLNRVYGERVDNHRRAAHALRGALEIFAPDDSDGRRIATVMLATAEGTRPEPSQWTGPDVAELRRLLDELDPSENLGVWGRAALNLANTLSVGGGSRDSWQEALDVYDRALAQVTADDDLELWLMLHVNAAAHALRRAGEPGGGTAMNLARSHAEIAVRDGSRMAYPLLWAMAHRNLGAALAHFEPRDIEAVAGHYGDALSIATPEQHPTECLGTAAELGWFMLENGRWSDALAAFRTATRAGRELLDQAASFVGRRVEVGPLGALHAAAAYCLLKLDRVAEAVDELDAGRTRLLGKLYVAVEASVPAEFASLAAAPPPAGDRVRVYLVVTAAGGAAIVLPRPAREPTPPDVVWFERLDRGAVRSFIAGRAIGFDLEADSGQADELIGLIGRTLYIADVAQTPERLLELLRTRIVEPLRAHIARTGGDPRATLELVPSDLLGMLPVHAAEPAVEGNAPPAICWIPLSRSAAPRVLGRRRRRLLALADPRGDLHWGAAEARIAAIRAGAGEVLIGEEATLGALRARIARCTHIHLACHARYDWRDPSRSGVELADGDRITVSMLLRREVDLSGVELVVLSGCDTSAVDVGAPEEQLGLGPAMLAAGCQSVVTALWPVLDAPTAILMAEFYRRLFLGDGEDVDHALSGACAWLRELSGEAARAAVRELAAVADTKAIAAELELLALHPPGLPPYADPPQWAAFVAAHHA